MQRHLHIDIETFSSVDITTCGSYKYFESLDFEILMIAYAFDNDPVRILDLAQGEALPNWFVPALRDPEVLKFAHNANFERNAFKAYGFESPIDQWYCTAVKSAYCGLPLSLDGVSKALKLGELGKSAEGKALIKYFSCPVKATKTNGMRTRNFPHHDLLKWESFKFYCVQDVEAEREIEKRLSRYTIPPTERLNYFLDQKINDRGVLIDTVLAANAVDFDNRNVSELTARAKEITGLDNPNSPVQLKKWLGCDSLTKASVTDMLQDEKSEKVREVLEIRQKLGKTSIKKYLAMINGVCDDSRVRGIHQFYGANRTGRWAGRMVQPQNMPRNYINFLDEARNVVRSGDYDLCTLLYDEISNILSQLTRTAIIAPEGKTFCVADFSAIEARVIAWLSGEAWRIKVFNTHGKIYEASASVMFNIPIESVTKESGYRDKGKVAELALGYQGAVGALKTMGGEAMGLTESEMETIVLKWRKANPAIVRLWSDLESCAMRSIETRSKIESIHKGITFETNDEVMAIKLPSGRRLFYQSPSFTQNKWGKKSIRYRGMNQETKQWEYVDTYGGKLTENIVQAIARDLLADAMRRVDAAGFDIVMHVHDEIIVELEDGIAAPFNMRILCDHMADTDHVYSGVPFPAEGYLTKYYKKD
jgi:DNA polymerase bacteriophage-type